MYKFACAHVPTGTDEALQEKAKAVTGKDFWIMTPKASLERMKELKDLHAQGAHPTTDRVKKRAWEEADKSKGKKSAKGTKYPGTDVYSKGGRKNKTQDSEYSKGGKNSNSSTKIEEPHREWKGYREPCTFWMTRKCQNGENCHRRHSWIDHYYAGDKRIEFDEQKYWTVDEDGERLKLSIARQREEREEKAQRQAAQSSSWNTNQWHSPTQWQTSDSGKGKKRKHKGEEDERDE